MKPEEAISSIKNNMPTRGTYTILTDGLHLAIQALEKQVPEKPNKCSYEPLIRGGWEYECPSCEKAVGLNKFAFDYTDEDPYCPSCGQAIDWEV